MKKTFLALILALAGIPAAMAQSTVSYALPQTTLEFTVEAVKETFHAGPYARFAGKYLGVDARLGEGTSYTISPDPSTPRSPG